jgi:hypothetical protein
MKNYNSKLIALLLVAVSVTFSSCKKGETGPQGPSGKDGNANVKNLTIFVNANEWVNKPGVSEVTKVVPEITADIVNKGAIMIYTEGNNSGQWEALPTTWPDPSITVALGYTIEAGKLHLSATFDVNGTLSPGTLQSSNFKVVLIAGSARAANPNVNLQNYPEVQTAYNLTN